MPDPTAPRPHSGADLARQALAAYKAGRSADTGAAKPARRKPRWHSGEGRDPQAFGTVLAHLGSEQGWTAGVRGGSIVDRFDELCPQYAARVEAVAYDAERGRLDVRPSSDAYAAQLRLLGGQVCRQINDKIGSDAVRSLRVLRVAPLVTPQTQQPAGTDSDRAAGPVRTRENASAGYHRTLAIHQAHLRNRADEAGSARLLGAAATRQTSALRAKRPVLEDDPEYAAQLEQLQPRGRRDEKEAAYQAALYRAHTGMVLGSRDGEPPRLFGGAA
ncbi:DciA family protein [Streptomyces sp. HUAS MG47]|uniref:DciA family protein n=1 Tax=Streptomyces solicamelliae TaxID=3231716 RepID=UPI003877B566